MAGNLNSPAYFTGFLGTGGGYIDGDFHMSVFEAAPVDKSLVRI